MSIFNKPLDIYLIAWKCLGKDDEFVYKVGVVLLFSSDHLWETDLVPWFLLCCSPSVKLILQWSVSPSNAYLVFLFSRCPGFFLQVLLLWWWWWWWLWWKQVHLNGALLTFGNMDVIFLLESVDSTLIYHKTVISKVVGGGTFLLGFWW